MLRKFDDYGYYERLFEDYYERLFEGYYERLFEGYLMNT